MTKTNPLYIPMQAKSELKTNKLQTEVTLGEETCARLKTIYFPSKKYQQVYRHLMRGLVLLKKIGKVYYPESNYDQILLKIRAWTDQDIKDAMEESKKLP